MEILELLLYILSMLHPQPVWVSKGHLSYYNETPTANTARNRLEWGQIPQDWGKYDVMIAIPNCGLIGKDGFLQYGNEVYTALVFDCGGGEDGGHQWMIDNNIVAEMSWEFKRKNPHLVHKTATVHIYEETTWQSVQSTKSLLRRYTRTTSATCVCVGTLIPY